MCSSDLFYSHQPKYLRRRFHQLSREELAELDQLALLILESPDMVIHKKQELMERHEKFFILTNSNMDELESALSQS